MEGRVEYLESELSNCQENLETLCLQLNVMQHFLQKQFGSRFVDYAVNRGVYIDTDINNTSQKYYNIKPVVQAVAVPIPNQPQKQEKTNFQSQIKIQDFLSIDNEGDEGEGDEYDYEGYDDGGFGDSAAVYDHDESEDVQTAEADTSDPLAFVETVDDQMRYERNVFDQDYAMANEYGNYMEQEYQELDSSEDPSSLVIVNCQTKQENGIPRRIPSPLHTTPRPPSTKTYSKPVNQNQPNLKPKPELTRKRPAGAGNSSSISTPSPSKRFLPALPKLQARTKSTTTPQTKAQSQSQSQLRQPKNEVLEYDSSSMDDILASGLSGVEENGRDPDAEDLREFYDVLPDKSVQCKICDKVLKAGWHKYGRHYRTHTGEKPFSCSYCGEKFARKDNMHNHVKSKHEKHQDSSALEWSVLCG